MDFPIDFSIFRWVFHPADLDEDRGSSEEDDLPGWNTAVPETAVTGDLKFVKW